MRQHIIIYCIIFLAIIFCSCNLGLTKCEDVQQWNINEYKIVKSKCLGPAGPHYYPLSLYEGSKFLGKNGFQKNDCTITFQAYDDLYLVFNICQNSLIEIKPDKKELDLKAVDSVQMFSNALNQTKLLSLKQIETFINDWNKGKVSDYRSGNVDSVFYPTFEYKLTVWSDTIKSEFLCDNFLISNKTNWTYYINEKEDTSYFDKIWNR